MAKKKTGSQSNLPAYSVYPPADAPSADRYAYELIKLFAGAMQALNGGILPMPKHWQEHLEDILEFHKIGKPPSPDVAARHTETRKLMLLDEMERDSGIKKQQSRTDFLEELAANRGYSDSAQVYRDTKPYESDAFSSILKDRENDADQKAKEEKIQRAKNIQTRLDNGETPEQILFDPDTPAEECSLLYRHQEHGMPLEEGHTEKLSDFEKAVTWMSHGMNLAIHPPGYPRYYDFDPETRAFVKKRSRRKKTKHTS